MTSQSLISPGRRLETTRVADAMTHAIIATGPDTPLSELAAMMATHQVHCVVVEGVSRDHHGERLSWGIVSDSDLVGALCSGADATAGQLCGSEVVTLDAMATLDDAARLLAGHETTHLVVTEAGMAAGVLSSLDIARVAGG